VVATSKGYQAGKALAAILASLWEGAMSGDWGGVVNVNTMSTAKNRKIASKNRKIASKNRKIAISAKTHLYSMGN
jgi:hypothetical protein